MQQIKEKELTELSDQELLEKRKKSKSTKIINAVIFGFMIGIAVYSTVKNGFGLFTFSPLLFAPMAINNDKNNKALETELKFRNLK